MCVCVCVLRACMHVYVISEPHLLEKKGTDIEPSHPLCSDQEMGTFLHVAKLSFSNLLRVIVIHMLPMHSPGGNTLYAHVQPF